jgi:high-affinity Fe2+/Pb2+ permease
MSSRKKVDKIDWKDDLLTGIELAIALILGFMFYNFVQANPNIKALLLPETLGMFMISFGIFVGGFLFIKWLNREKV